MTDRREDGRLFGCRLNVHISAQCVLYLQSGEDAGLLGVGRVTSGAGDAAETFGFTVESIPDAHHPTHLAGR